MRMRHRKWTDRVLEENQDIGKNLETLDIDSLPAYNYLEIGSGLGGFLLTLSKNHPENRYLGIEINRNAFASCIRNGSLVKAEQTNFLFVNSPVEKLFETMPENHFEAIYINHPDPWPKARQVKRRLTHPERLKEYFRFLKPGGKLYFRTDNIGLFEDSVEYFKEFGKFDIEIIQPFYSENYDFLPATEYEKKFRAKGVMISVLIATKPLH